MRWKNHVGYSTKKDYGQAQESSSAREPLQLFDLDADPVQKNLDMEKNWERNLNYLCLSVSEMNFFR